MRITVDRGRCQGTGFCVQVAAKYLSLGSDGVAAAREVDVRDEDLEDAREAELICPTQAIALVEAAE